MKSSRCFSKSLSFFNFSVAVPMLMAAALASPALAQSESDRPADITDSAPPSTSKFVQVMVEMNDVAAAVPYAEAFKIAQAQADAARNYALTHPNLRTSQALLKSKQSVQISSAATSQVQSVVRRNDQAQKNILPSLTAPAIGGKVIYRVQRAYNGIALVVSPDKIAAIASMPGVKAVHPMHPKFQTATFSDIDFLGGRSFWTKPPLGIHGDNIKVADIDSGLDYIHRNFGGPGSVGYSDTSASGPGGAHTVAPNNYFPTQKVPGGYDFAGDAYAATNNASDPSNTPHPDPDPFDCGGHGTATASLIGGFGITNAGFTYAGSYDASNPAMSGLSLPPGFAPSSKLYPLRVFGCGGSTNLVVQAIEWAMDPNGDGNFSDHMDVINMSLGSNEGFADDADDVAASNAATIGILVCSAAGNAGDSYYIHSSPAAASGTLGVAASFNDQKGFIFDSKVVGNQPPSFAGAQDKTIYTTSSPHISATGDVVYGIPHDGGTAGTPLTNAAQCAGKIVLFDRVPGKGATAAGNAKAAGAIGVIDISDSGNPFLLTTDAANPPLNSNIGGPPAPMVVCSTSFGNAIKAAAAFDPTTGLSTSAPPCNVTISPDSGTVVQPTNPPGSPAGAGSPDTLPTYTSRGPRMPDSAIKPDITAPAEVTAVAQNNTGNKSETFNGTSSATPHVAGTMALLKQFHPTWSVQELNALACATATHDLATTVAGSTLIGVGRIGAGRIDLTNASNANVVAYNATDPNLIGVSFGVVETPVDSSKTLTKNITVANKGGTNVTYNLSIQNNPALAGATYSFPSGSSFTVNAGTTATIPVQFAATGNLLKHAREASVASTEGGRSRQWLTEAAGYAVFTPTDSSPTLRVALYAAPKPIAASHATTTGVVPTAPNTGSFTINLSGPGVNTGASLGNNFDILSLVKPFELQYASSDAANPQHTTDRNVLKYVGVTSDYPNQAAGAGKANTRVVFGIEHFGDSPEPNAFGGRDTEIFFDTNLDGIPDSAIFLSRAGTGAENVYVPTIIFFDGTPAQNVVGSSVLTSVRVDNLDASVADTNAFNNSAVVVPLKASAHLGLIGASGTGPTAFQYQVVTFDRNGNAVDFTPFLYYDLANPGLETANSGSSAGVAKTPAAGSFVEPYYYNDLPTNFIPVNYNGTNFGNNGSLGVLLLHMHNGDGNRADVVDFLAPTITGFSPTHAKVGAFVAITGSNFGPGTRVFFQGPSFSAVEATPVNVLTANTLSVRVPPGAVSGFIRVQNAAGSNTIGGFTVDP